MSGRGLLLGAALLLIPFLVPVPEELERMRALRSLGVFAHFGLPAALTVVLYRGGPLRGSVLKAGAAAFLLAAGAELLQVFVHRHPRWQDAGIDLAGVVTAAGFVVWRRDGRRVALAWALVGLAALTVKMHRLPGFFLAERAALERFPLIADFETGLEMFLWDRNVTGHGSYERGPDPDGGAGRVVRLSASPHHRFPGILARGLPRDWSGYDRLVFRVRQAEGAPCRIAVRLDDFASRHDGLGVGRGFDVGPAWRTCELDLASEAASASRPFRLDDIDSLLLYLGRVQDDVVVLIDDIHLE